MSLEQKLKEIAQQRQTVAIDWDQRRDEWIRSVEELYSQIEEWFRDLLEQGLMAVRRTPKELSEEYLGTYQIEVLQIEMGDTTVVLDPVGRNIIGATGRIDMYVRGYRDDAMLLIRVELEEGNPTWQIRKRTDTGFRIDLSKDALEQIFESWV